MKFLKDYQKATVKELFISKYTDLNYSEIDYHQTRSVKSIDLNINGIIGERHYGLMERSDGRVKHIYQKNTEIRNNRQWTAMSVYEKELIDKEMGLNGQFRPEQIGMNILLDGYKNLSTLPPLTYLVFTNKNELLPEDSNKVVLVIYGEILPCAIAGRSVAKETGLDKDGTLFPKKSIGYRGTSGWVERGGKINIGDNVFIYLPKGQT